MYISARERQILEILLTESEELTVKDLADEIGVSSRTIHRDLKNVEDILEEYQLSLHKKSGVGVQITGDKEKINELELFLFNLYHTEYTPDERQTIILCELLESPGPVKLLGLANDLNVTIATVSTDLTKLEEKLQTFGLTLIRRRGYGVEIEGEEGAKRRAMSHLISVYLDESELLSLARETIQKRSNQQINTISERLLGLVDKRKLLVVEKVVEANVQELPFTMADSAYIGLVVHLALAVERIQKGEGITIDPAYLENQKPSKEYKIAEKMSVQLEQLFQISIPEAEIIYITMHLKGAKLRHDQEYLVEDSSLSVAIKTKNLIHYIENRIGINLSANQSLFEGLVLHLKPAMYRLKQKMGIANPLLGKMKRDYPDLFSIVKEAANQVFHEFAVPDEEIGYLVMHFGAALLGKKQLSKVKTLVVCSSGIGTSKMLATRLEQEFPELSEIRNVSVREFKKMKMDDYELIISTIPISDAGSDYILVSPILNKEEIDKIRSYLHEKIMISNSQRQLPVLMNSTKTLKRLEEDMRNIQTYTETIANILEGFDLHELTSLSSSEEILQAAVLRLFTKQRIHNKEEVMNALKRREALGGLGIPGTGMVLYHARTHFANLPTFTIYFSKNPITTLGMDQNMMEARTFVFMISPEETTEKVLEVLSFLSSLLIESEESMEVFQSNDHEKITVLLSARLDQFFTKKMNEIRSV